MKHPPSNIEYACVSNIIIMECFAGTSLLRDYFAFLAFFEIFTPIASKKFNLLKKPHKIFLENGNSDLRTKMNDYSMFRRVYVHGDA